MLSRTEEMLLLAVCRLQEEAFGINIRKEVESVTGRRYSVGGIYVPLDRLVKKGLLVTSTAPASPDRLGRPRRLFRVTSVGFAVLRDARALHEAMWASLPDPVIEQLGYSI